MDFFYSRTREGMTWSHNKMISRWHDSEEGILDNK